MADPRRLRELLGFGYGAPSPAMSALEPFHAGVDPAYMPQDVVTESPTEGPRGWVRSGLESLFGAIAPSERAASNMAEKVTNLSDFVNLPQEAFDIGKGIGDAVQGGDKLGLAMSMLPGKAADELVPAVKAAQRKLSDEMLRNATPAVQKPGYNQVSGRKLLRPYSEMTASYAPGPPLLDMPEKEFDFESIPENSWMVGLVGDRTMGGQYLTGVNDSIFTNPVELQAGSDFLRRADNPDDAFWASDKGVIDKYVKQIRPLQETGDDVYALTVAMGGEAGDYSRQTTNAILETIRQKPLSQEAKDAIDTAMRTKWGGAKEGSKPKFIAYEDWPGVDNVTPEYLKTAGSARTKFAKLMDRGDIGNLTGIDMGSIRKAITHPELLGSEAEDMATLSTGHRIAKVGPDAVRAITDPKVPHADYAAQLAARGTEFKGGVKPIPGVAFWQDWYGKQKPGSSGSSLQRSATTQGLIQRKTPEWVDRLMAFKESEVGKRLGLTGAISAGLITASEAEEMFGYEGESGGG